MSSTQCYGFSLLERLEKAGVSASFSVALRSNDTDLMSSLLCGIGYSKESAKAMIKTFLDDPNVTLPLKNV